MERYQELYGINLEDMSPYNMIIDADNLDALEVLEMVQRELRIEIGKYDHLARFTKHRLKVRGKSIF